MLSQDIYAMVSRNKDWKTSHSKNPAMARHILSTGCVWCSSPWSCCPGPCQHGYFVQQIQLTTMTAEHGNQAQELEVLKCKLYTFLFILRQLFMEPLQQRKNFQLQPDGIVNLPDWLTDYKVKPCWQSLAHQGSGSPGSTHVPKCLPPSPPQ